MVENIRLIITMYNSLLSRFYVFFLVANNDTYYLSDISANAKVIFSGAPAGAEGARGRSSIAIEIGKSIKPRKFGGRPRPSVRTYVRTYARIRPGDEFIFVLIWSPS